MPKNTYWIADPDGVKALVDGADQRDLWTRVRGWSLADEPGRQDRIWLYHEGIDGRTVLTKEAADGYWSGAGWVPGAPPEPVDLTKDPTLTDAPEDTPSPVPAAKTPAKSDTQEK